MDQQAAQERRRRGLNIAEVAFYRRRRVEPRADPHGKALSRRPTRFNTPRRSPAASARAAAVISGSI
jgi:hypothetical protein